jgi:glycerol-3-phosphate dehydrogenase
MFPAAGLSPNDIESSWAGLRPLIHEEGKSASELSRKDEIFESPTGLISIAGGKLTGYRKMSERVVDLVIRNSFSGRSFPACKTQTLKLAGQGFSGVEEVKLFLASLAQQLQSLELPASDARYLVENYGKQALEIVKVAGTYPRSSDPDERMLKAEAAFALQHEMILTLADFFVRRTGFLYFDIAKVRRWKEVIAGELKSHIGWDQQRLQKELAGVDLLIERATTFT